MQGKPTGTQKAYSAKVPMIKGDSAEWLEHLEWLKEERRGKKTVCIVGFAQTTRGLAPYDDPDVEIWGLNEAYRHDFMKDSEGNFRADNWMQIHKPWSYQRLQNKNHPNHWLWLKDQAGECGECRGTGVPLNKSHGDTCPDCDGSGWYKPKLRKDFPIYMQEADPAVPGAVKYPLDEVVEAFITKDGKPLATHGEKPVEYFTSTYAYLLALILYQNRDNLDNLRVETYGFEMSTETEYAYQKGSTEWWIGMAMGMGVQMYFPEHCQLLKGAKYGFEVTQMINRQELEFRERQLLNAQQERVAELNKISGMRQQVEEIGMEVQSKFDGARGKEKGKLEEQLKELLERRNKLMSDEVNALGHANAVGGALQEVQMLIGYIDAQYNIEDAAMDVHHMPKPSVGSKQSVLPKGEVKDAGQEEEEAHNPEGSRN